MKVEVAVSKHGATETKRLIRDGENGGGEYGDGGEVMINVLRCQLTY